MPDPKFPHLPLLYHGLHRANLHGGGKPDPRVTQNRNNRTSHTSSLRRGLAGIRRRWRKALKERAAQGLPQIGDRIVLGLLLPPNQLDLTFIEKQFGLELVSEGDDGLILAGSPDLDFEKFMDALRHFAGGTAGGANAAQILELYGPDDDARLDTVLDENLRSRWPFQNDEELVLDVLIEVPHHPGYVRRKTKRGPKGEDPETKASRLADFTEQATLAAAIAWDEQRDQRVSNLECFIRANGGEILAQLDDGPEEETGIVTFPDCVLMRVRMSGRGFRDLVMSIPWLVRLETPPGLESHAGDLLPQNEMSGWELKSPKPDAPRVCVIDSGIQEEHRCLAPAILTADSRCFLPSKGADDTQDEVSPSGHGTKVAGAVLYPELPIADAEVEAVAWIQNARVLNGDNQFDSDQNPLKSLQEIVRLHTDRDIPTRLYVHSINAREACRTTRMTAWAALLDTHAHEDDVLIFQSAGNIAPSNPSPNRFGVRQHLNSGRKWPDYLLEKSCRLAAPAQSLHAITVGSVSSGQWKGTYVSAFSDQLHRPSAFSRSGLGLWGSVKPDVVEVGGDYQCSDSGDVLPCNETAPILIQSTLHRAGAIGRDVGTSFAAPKVAHIGAALQRLFPNACSQLYRALIINSARWPQWAEDLPESQRLDALRMIGYGLPNLQRATENTPTRVTLITAEAQVIRNGKAMIYQVPIPLAIRDAPTPTRVRIDVTLCYTAEPRQTRSTRHGYLETWLGWMASRLEEPLDSFVNRAARTMESGGVYTELPWMLRERKDWGGIEGVARQNGTAQKDWAVVPNAQLPDQFAIAIQAHKGWNREEHGGHARFALVVSFEALDAEIAIHDLVRAEVEARIEQVVRV